MSEEIVAAVEQPAEAVDTSQNTEEQAVSETPEEVKPEELTPEQVAKRNQNRLDRKLDKAYKKAAESQARAEFAERMLNEERQKVVPVKQSGEPTIDNFDSIEDYAKAVSDFARKQVAEEAQTKQREETTRQMTARLTSSWESKVLKGEDKYDDFYQSVGELKPNSPMAVAIMEAENGEDIAYYLHQNPEETKRIMQLYPLAQSREIGKLEARLSAEPPKPKTPSNAPAPIKPVGNAGSPSMKKLSEMTQQEFDKKRREYIANKR